MDYWSGGKIKAIFLEHEVNLNQPFHEKSNVCLFQGYFSAVGCLREFIMDENDLTNKMSQD